jgi:hypothetical protein
MQISDEAIIEVGVNQRTDRGAFKRGVRRRHGLVEKEVAGSVRLSRRGRVRDRRAARGCASNCPPGFTSCEIGGSEWPVDWFSCCQLAGYGNERTSPSALRHRQPFHSHHFANYSSRSDRRLWLAGEVTPPLPETSICRSAPRTIVLILRCPHAPAHALVIGRGLLVRNAVDRAFVGSRGRAGHRLDHFARAFGIGDPLRIEVVRTGS